MGSLFKHKSINTEFHEARGKIPLWKLAEKAGISEATIVRWLRVELSQEKKEKLLIAIREVKKEQLAEWGL